MPASCLRNHLMLKEMKEGRGPIYMDTLTALAKLKETLSPREVKHLEAEAWEDFLTCALLEEIDGILLGFVRGLSGRRLKLQQGNAVYTVSETLYLPPVISYLPHTPRTISAWPRPW